MMKKLTSFFVLLLFVSTCMFAQWNAVGTVVDKGTGEPIPGVNVFQKGTSNGTITDWDGNFTLKVNDAQVDIDFSFMGYLPVSVNVQQQGSKVNLGTIVLAEDTKTLDDIVVVQSVAVQRKTPVALSSLDATVIDEKLGAQEFPEVLKSTPGVYATKQGGGYGDSRINMRGFSSANVAVLINGVPMNDMEWGGVYWSNFAGLSDVTRSMQTQRGLGASKVSSPSVGGSINIVTKSIDSKAGGSISYAIGPDGYNKLMASFSTGMNESGWSLTMLGSKTWGDGYVMGTQFEAYNWFVNVAKRLNDNHQLSFTALGAPQWHYQRSIQNGLTILGWQQIKDYVGDNSVYKYNATVGYDKNGQYRNSSKNNYHKPIFSLNHQWQINENQNLSTAAYVSTGRGWGLSGQGDSDHRSKWYGASSGTLNMDFRHEDGTFAYDEIQDLNAKSENGSVMVMSKSTNDHTWLGLLSTYNHDLTNGLEISGGVDFRWYKGVHKNIITDLYDGAYYIDSNRASVKAENNSAANDPDFKNKKLHVGDVVYRNYDGYTVQGGVFGQVEYTKDVISAFVSASVNRTSYWKRDYFYYDADHEKSEVLDFIGYTVKGGANFNLDDKNNVFANVGYISRVPFFQTGAFLMAATSNATNPDAVNEKIMSAELGYGFKSAVFSANLNGYFTKWMDKTMARSSDIKVNGEVKDRWTINMEGVDARHMGIELDMKFKPAKWVDFNAMLSLGNWIWDADTEGYFYNSQGQPLKESNGTLASGLKTSDHAKMHIVLDKVKVGGSAQTTAALGAHFKPMKGLNVGADWTLFAKNYADWSISTNNLVFNGELKYSDPYELPAACTVDLNASYTFNLSDKVKATISGNVTNLLDQEYITDATDTQFNGWSGIYCVYGQGRNSNVRIKITF